MRLPEVAVEAVSMLKDFVAQLAGNRALDAVQRLEVATINPTYHQCVTQGAFNPTRFL